MELYVIVVENFRTEPIDFYIFNNETNAKGFYNDISKAWYEDGWAVSIRKYKSFSEGRFFDVETLEEKYLNL